MPSEEPPTPRLAPPSRCTGVGTAHVHCAGCAEGVVLEAERERLRAVLLEIRDNDSPFGSDLRLIAGKAVGALLAGVARPHDPLSEEEREGLAFVRRYSENGHCNGREERLLTIIDKLLTARGLAASEQE